MADEEAERISLDSYKTKGEAEAMLHVYAKMLAANHLTENFGVKVGKDAVRTQKGRLKAKTWDVFLIVRNPDLPLPKFLTENRYQFKHKPPVLYDTTPLPERPQKLHAVEDEDEPDNLTTLPRGAVYEVGGQLKTLREWADEVGIKYVTLMGRLHNGWSLVEALTTPVQSRKSS